MPGRVRLRPGRRPDRLPPLARPGPRRCRPHQSCRPLLAAGLARNMDQDRHWIKLLRAFPCRRRGKGRRLRNRPWRIAPKGCDRPKGCVAARRGRSAAWPAWLVKAPRAGSDGRTNPLRHRLLYTASHTRSTGPWDRLFKSQLCCTQLGLGTQRSVAISTAHARPPVILGPGQLAPLRLWQAQRHKHVPT